MPILINRQHHLEDLWDGVVILKENQVVDSTKDRKARNKITLTICSSLYSFIKNASTAHHYGKTCQIPLRTRVSPEQKGILRPSSIPSSKIVRQSLSMSMR